MPGVEHRDGEKRVGWWTIPGEHTKNGEPHRVPLTPTVAVLIRSLAAKDNVERGEYVFVGRGGASVLDRAKKAPSAVARTLGVDFRGHDLRRTAATQMAAGGIGREHISRVLNHVEGGARATRVYDRYTYDIEKRVALETWERRLLSILSEKSSADVGPFAR